MSFIHGCASKNVFKKFYTQTYFKCVFVVRILKGDGSEVTEMEGGCRQGDVLDTLADENWDVCSLYHC